MVGAIFLIVVICIGALLIAFNTNYFQGVQGIQGIAGINGLNFNSTVPYTFLFNGTQGIQGIQGIQGLTGSSGLISVSLPLVNNSGVLSLNTLSLTHNNITDWSSATSSFLTQSTQYISSFSGVGNVNNGLLTVNAVNAVTANEGLVLIGNTLSLSNVPYSVTNFADKNLLTSSSPTFSSVIVKNNLLTYDQVNTNNYWKFLSASNVFYFEVVIGGINTAPLTLDSSGNLAISGNMVIDGTLTEKYMSGDYGALWASISLPSGVNGMQLVAYNSNAGVLASRLYIYSNSAWHYVMLT